MRMCSISHTIIITIIIVAQAIHKPSSETKQYPLNNSNNRTLHNYGKMRNAKDIYYNNNNSNHHNHRPKYHDKNIKRVYNIQVNNDFVVFSLLLLLSLRW